MFVRRTATRSLGVLALTGPLAAAMLFATAPSASAAATWTTPSSEGQVFSSGGSVAVTATVAACASTAVSCSETTLSVSGPSFSASSKVTSRRGAETPVTVTLPASARNGQYTGSLSGGSSGSRTLFLNVAPAAPSGFSAQGSGARDVSFTWSKGSEVDLSGYALYDDAGAVVDDNIALSACSGNTCSYGLYYPADNAGTHSYQLAARRASGGCGTCGSSLESGKSSANATLTDPPKPTPSPTPSATPSPTGEPSTGGTTGGSTGGTTGGSSTGGSSAGTTGGTSGGGSSTGGSTGGTTGGTSTGTSGGSTGTAVQSGPKPTLPTLADPVLASRRAFALQFNAFSPSLGIPKLPPLPSITLPSFGEAPLPQGTFDPQLPYDPQIETDVETVSDGTLARPVAAVRDVLDSERLAKSLAGALILMLAGAHLRRFLGTHAED